ncbi:glutathione synthetase [Saprolegnia parasitica CBS 223.65]|uniref:Glutathione synthetase n=1 Tax=Saprolegnia parasitica (strain CBS 223.65) TaxID=695850 RepID=A0A067C3W7_SAPPC|nr:glutathione synthetase [Saprolegnia parasitica CBS 223.65]KDO25173.1 glutathione synthetase [Saprolegnia parasitica CBS 223.65]|eukprot:XP_012204039.1 glutathione synthetase [Saprolegnia parasitica CBS 223.65]
MADLLASLGAGSSSTAPPAPLAAAHRMGLSEDDAAFLLAEATAFAAGHGMLVQAPAQRYAHLPYCLLPVKFPKSQFDKGVALGPLFGTLVDRISEDPDWLHAQLQSVLAEDPFTRRLVELSKKVQAQGRAQPASLGIFRSDYMLHDDPRDASAAKILQVELNTISASFASMSSMATELHTYILSRFEDDIPALAAYYGTSSLASHLPSNAALQALPAALAAAHAHYGRPAAVVLFVVQPNESNSVDQRWLEYTLWTTHKIKVLRRTLLEMHAATTDATTKALLVDGKYEVAVAYFRAGYTPTDYPSEREWAGRDTIETSRAIKCPNVTYHLAGTKKVQQVLADPAQLRRFMSDADSRVLEACFTGLYGLEATSPTLAQIQANVRANPHAYVLKPQREGGGNNFYGDDVVVQMDNMTPAELESYILMDRIVPQETPAILVRNGQAVAGATISELGLYSVSLFEHGQPLLNAHAGHLLRTKLSSTNEGGVAAGFAVLSSPFLV